MGQRNRSGKKQTKRYKEESSPLVDLFSFFDASIGALMSIVNNDPERKRKTYYRVYKQK
jgi:hypothetical protein